MVLKGLGVLIRRAFVWFEDWGLKTTDAVAMEGSQYKRAIKKSRSLKAGATLPGWMQGPPADVSGCGMTLSNEVNSRPDDGRFEELEPCLNKTGPR